jgi:multimeric flavodoxin WrbA
MRIIAIVGSVRRGNTYAMVEAACHALKDSEVEFVHLKDTEINLCDGCLTCDKTGTCHIKDAMTALLPRIKAADGFIFGTPARWSLLSGELKVFFDRLNPLAMPQALKGKKAVIFAVGQTEGEEAVSIKLAARSVKYFCDNAGIEVVGTVLAEGCLEADKLITRHKDVLEKCKKTGLRLAHAISKR